MATATRQGTLPYYIEGARKRTVTNVAMDSSYPTNGEVITAADLGLNHVDHAIAQVQDTATTTVNVANANYIPATGGATGNLELFDETPAEIANAADVAGLVVRIVAWGH